MKAVYIPCFFKCNRRKQRVCHKTTPRDRDGTFQPETVKKRETILANGMADQIIEMYAMGTSTRDISSYFEREFNTTLSADTISSITDRVLPEITIAIS